MYDIFFVVNHIYKLISCHIRPVHVEESEAQGAEGENEHTPTQHHLGGGIHFSTLLLRTTSCLDPKVTLLRISDP